jgi:hypothetical protein
MVMRDGELGLAGSDLSPAPPDIAEQVQRTLRGECRFDYDLAQFRLNWMELRFYPPGTWLCQLESQPRPRRVSVAWRKPELPARVTHYFVFRPTDESLPIMPLGDDTDWVLRANKYYEVAEDQPSLAAVLDEGEPEVLHKIVQYLQFYYSFTRYDGYVGGLLSFTTLQVASDPQVYAGDVAGQRVLRTFFGHATIAFPGVPYVLGAFDLDPLEWLKEPNMKSAMVFGFRAMMLLVVYRAFWKLLGYASPRILARDSRRLEHEIAKLRRSRRGRAATDGPADPAASAAVP